jgi:GxxExxY protein
MTLVPDSMLTRRVIGCAIDVHRQLGPGLLESVYETCLCDELATAELPFVRKRSFPVRYKGRELDQFFQMDVIVAEALVLEIKAMNQINSLHEAQLLTYLRLSGYQLDLLLNFNAIRLVDGIRRIACSVSGTDEAHSRPMYEDTSRSRSPPGA